MYFYAILAIAYHALSMLGPNWNPDSSTNQLEPRLEFRPMFVSHGTESPLISFRHGAEHQSSWQPWVDRLQTVIKPYDEPQQDRNVVMCDFNRPPSVGNVCHVDLRGLGPNCSSERFFGYDQGHPCVLLKMNQVHGWIPEPYSSADLPPDFPLYMKEAILRRRPDKQMVWVSCEGENLADRENLGPIVYIPDHGFPTYFFPYNNNTQGYKSPIIMMQFLKPTIGMLINIKCKVWARNLGDKTTKGHITMHFELLIE